MPDLHQIPHLDEIAHHGEYHGVGKRVTETFADRYHHQNKVVPSLEDAIRLTGLRDGMTISFHHHFRNGDHIVNMVLDKLAEMGFHDLKLAASSLSAIHAPLIRHIQNGVITHIETSGMRGELAEAVSRGLMDCPVVFRSHGGRASAIRTGELHIDVAFLGAPSCDPYGNANGYSRDDDEGIACGSLGYARPDAAYADEVVIITNHLVAYPNAPWAIPEDEVDYVVVTDDIGDPKGIMSGATRYTKDPKELLIARNAANVIDAAGYLIYGFSMQMGSGGASLATARFLRQKMLDRGIHCRFALGGITGQITAKHEEGLIDRILDVQSFDLDAAKSLKNNHFHHQIGATYYASYLVGLRRRSAGLCCALCAGDRHGLQCQRSDRIGRRHPRRYRRPPRHGRGREPVRRCRSADARPYPDHREARQHGRHARRRRGRRRDGSGHCRQSAPPRREGEA